VLIPLLAFDRKGHRVGYGKGYYDRFLRTCRKDVVKIGFSYFDPVEKIEDASRYDVRLNYCITPNDIYRF
jgi:5-formyltetrahydrofolate cyclo-ligase